MRSSCAVRGTRWAPLTTFYTHFPCLTFSSQAALHFLTGCLLRCVFGGQQRNELPSLSGAVQAV